MFFTDTVEKCSELAGQSQLDLSYNQLIMCALYVELSSFPEKGNRYLFDLKTRFSRKIPFTVFDGLVSKKWIQGELPAEVFYPLINEAFEALHIDDLAWIQHLYDSPYFREQLSREDANSDYGEDNRYFIGYDEYSDFFNEDCLWSFFDRRPYPKDTGEWPIKNHHILKGYDLSQDFFRERINILTLFSNPRIKTTICLIESKDGFKKNQADGIPSDTNWIEKALGIHNCLNLPKKEATMIAHPDRIIADNEFVLQDYYLDDPQKVVSCHVLGKKEGRIDKKDYTLDWRDNLISINRYHFTLAVDPFSGAPDPDHPFIGGIDIKGLTSVDNPLQRFEEFINYAAQLGNIQEDSQVEALIRAFTGHPFPNADERPIWNGNVNVLLYIVKYLFKPKKKYKMMDTYIDIIFDDENHRTKVLSDPSPYADSTPREIIEHLHKLYEHVFPTYLGHG